MQKISSNYGRKAKEVIVKFSCARQWMISIQGKEKASITRASQDQNISEKNQNHLRKNISAVRGKVFVFAVLIILKYAEGLLQREKNIRKSKKFLQKYSALPKYLSTKRKIYDLELEKNNKMESSWCRLMRKLDAQNQVKKLQK